MVLKMAQILNAYNWAASMRSKNIPYTAAFLIASNLNNMENDMKNFENQKISMLEQYGKKDSDGNLIVNEDNSVELGDKESFAKDFNKLNRTEQNLIKLWRSSKPHIRAAITTLLKECK